MFKSSSAFSKSTSTWRIKPAETALVLVDPQEKLLAAMPERDLFEKKLSILAQGCKLLDIPLYGTEQYPEGLGAIPPSLRKLIDADRIYEKTRFSAGECGAGIDKNTILLAGVEAHICIRQTAYDLRAQGKTVIIVVDAIASRDLFSKQVTLWEMQMDHFFFTTVETVLFEIMEDAKHPKFKEISALVK